MVLFMKNITFASLLEKYALEHKIQYDEQKNIPTK